jgi:glutamine amidotransferase
MEGGLNKGLGLINGSVEKIRPTCSNLRIPHVGWNEISVNRDVLFDKLGDGVVKPTVYFAHSYHVVLASYRQAAIIATCDYGLKINAAIRKDNIVGLQFHPEKSQQTGLYILKQFVESIK